MTVSTGTSVMRDRTGTLRWCGVQRSPAGWVSSTGQASKAGGSTAGVYVA
ncbi:hypothetical protein [Streptomyces sp. NPDC002463]